MAKKKLDKLGQPIPNPFETPTPAAAPTPKPAPDFTPKIIRDEETGQVTGVSLPDGRTILGKSRDIMPLIQAKTPVTPAGTQELAQIRQQENIIQEAARRPVIQPQPLREDINPQGTDLLDIGKIAGGAVGGATAGAGIGAGIGSVVPIAGTAAGAIVGGIIGGIGGAVTAWFYSSAGERRQQTKVSFNNFKDATTQLDNIMKDVNAMHYSNEQARSNRDNELARIRQAERELKAQQSSLFGEKLSRSLDELSKIEAWKRRFQQWNIEFEASMVNPNPAKIFPSIADTSIDIST